MSESAALPVVASLERTCMACPAQWDLTLADGRYVYVRYRGGLFRAEIAANETDWWNGKHEQLFRLPVGDPLDGFMEDAEMMAHLAGVLDFSQVKSASP